MIGRNFRLVGATRFPSTLHYYAFPLIVALNNDEIRRNSRHLILPEVGLAGQKIMGTRGCASASRYPIDTFSRHINFTSCKTDMPAVLDEMLEPVSRSLGLKTARALAALRVGARTQARVE